MQLLTFQIHYTDCSLRNFYSITLQNDFTIIHCINKIARIATKIEYVAEITVFFLCCKTLY